MESLESKLDRLTPDQRRFVEEFVDYLISRSAPPQPVSAVPPAAPVIPPVMTMAPPAPPVLSIQESQPVPPPQPAAESPEPAEPVMTEITAGGSDWVTRDYLDYGQFEEEQQPSPATEAIKKVKRKLIMKGEEEKPRQILDWID